MSALEGAPWAVDDSRWFTRHPNRQHRVRRPHSGEWEKSLNHYPVPAGCRRYVIVSEILPGYRLRAGLGSKEVIPNTEEAARGAFDLVLPLLKASEAEVREITRAVGASDDCQGCGRAFKSGELTLIGLSHLGGPIDVGACCVWWLSTRICFSFYFGAAELLPALLMKMPPEGRA